jgi:hypothetical protein
MPPTQRQDWNTNPLPEKHITLTVDDTFTADEMGIIQQGLLPRQMEDKWFLFYEADTLYVHRSWTGNCIFVADFMPHGDGYRITRLRVNQDPEQYTETHPDRLIGSFRNVIRRLLR